MNLLLLNNLHYLSHSTYWVWILSKLYWYLSWSKSSSKWIEKLKQIFQFSNAGKCLCLEGSTHSLLLQYGLLKHFWRTVEMFLKMLKWSFLLFCQSNIWKHQCFSVLYMCVRMLLYVSLCGGVQIHIYRCRLKHSKLIVAHDAKVLEHVRMSLESLIPPIY